MPNILHCCQFCTCSGHCPSLIQFIMMMLDNILQCHKSMALFTIFFLMTTKITKSVPTETPAPALPETEETKTRPDVVPHPVYDDLNTLSRNCFYSFWLAFSACLSYRRRRRRSQQHSHSHSQCVGRTYSC